MGEPPALALHLVVFLAGALQTVTGVGFALVAGPFLLVMLHDGSAIEVSILLNLFTALLLGPALIRHLDRRSLGELLPGALLGLPVGTLLFAMADLAMLKLGAGVLVAAALWPYLRPKPAAPTHRSRWVGVASGAVAGAMTGFAAMPGPAASYYVTGIIDLPRDSARATIFVFFIIAYTAAFVLHWILTGIHAGAFGTTLWLIPATAAGMLAGAPLAGRVTQRQFRVAIALVLAGTATALIISAGGH
jgi:uncharacterized membrane protein YfcA